MTKERMENARYLAAELRELQEQLQSLPTTQDSVKGSMLLRTYEREWNIDWNSLHYRFELQVWTQIPEPMLPMQSMEYREEIRDG